MFVPPLVRIFRDCGGAAVTGVRYCADGSAVESEFNVVTVQTGGLAPPATPRLGNVSSSCGWCGSEQLDEMCERLAPLPAPASIDLDLLAALLSYPEAAVAKAVRTRLAQLLPDEGASDWGPWIKKHRDRLQWDSKLRRYTHKR